MGNDLIRARQALISLSDKSGLAGLAEALARHGIGIISTGGTAEALRQLGHPVREVSAVTGFPEMMDGRVKTLHPMIHGGLLARRDDPAHLAAMTAHGIGAIDLLIVSLYPFEATVAAGAGPAAAIENIDIGGPAMIRSAAKNHEAVAAVCDATMTRALIAELDARNGATSLAFRRQAALAAFALTAGYDAAIAAWMAGQGGEAAPVRVLSGRLVQNLRYGENPHQAAAFYSDGTPGPSLARAVLHQGKDMSWNNINDADAALALAAEFDPAEAAVVIVKHANPCGVARGAGLLAAWQAALASDPVSAFGGIVALNRRLDGPTAAAIAGIFTEVVIAPDADEAAHAVFAAKKNLRLLTTGTMPDAGAAAQSWRQVRGGFLVQDADVARLAEADLRVVTRRQPGEDVMRDLLFAFTVAKHVKSNAIVFARDGATVGIGAGQMSRIDSTLTAARKAGDRARGAVAASDAFFPFADGVKALAEAGIAAVIQPGGALRDAEVIAAADAAGLAMVFTGQRHFRH